MTYQEAMTYLESCRVLGSRPGLSSIQALLVRMNNPQDKLRVIHVAGTNGKGSTGNFLLHILFAAGYRVGFFSSPAVFSPREMIRVNGNDITEQDFARAVCKAKIAAERMQQDGLYPPTEFEILTAAAYWYFHDAGCDYAIAECGMGGRQDATNIVKNTEVSVLCRIDYDHMDYLGSSLSAITKEKCGILRKNKPVTVYPVQEKEALDEIIRAAKEVTAPLFLGNTKKLKVITCNQTGSVFSYAGFENLTIGLLGEHQIYNAITAVETVLALRHRGVMIPDAALYQGLSSATIAGRFEVLSTETPVILDGAHNLNGVQAFCSSVKKCYPQTTFIGVVGMLEDKDYKASLTEFANVCRLLVLTQVHNTRTAKLSSLKKAAEALNHPFVLAETPEQAVQMAFAERKSGEGIFCAGSLYNLQACKKTCEEMLPGKSVSRQMG